MRAGLRHSAAGRWAITLAGLLAAAPLLTGCAMAWRGPSGPAVVSSWLLGCLASQEPPAPAGFRKVARLKDFPTSPQHPIYRADTPDGTIYAFRYSNELTRRP